MSSPISSKARDYDNIITSLQKGLSGTIGDEFLTNLIEELANVLSASTAIIGIITEDGLSIDTVAVIKNGSIAPNFNYELEGTPCHETTAASEACIFAKGVAKLFPDDEALRTQGIVSYVGFPLVDSQNKVIGIINTLHKNELKDPDFAVQIIKIFSSRASAEIERRLQSRVLEEKEKFQNALNRIFEAILPRKSEEEILWEVAEQCVEVLNPTDCVIYIYEEESELLIQKAAVNRTNNITSKVVSPMSIPLGGGIVGSVGKKRVGEIISDTSQDSRYIADGAARYSEIAAPIIVNDKLIGVIDSEHPEKGYFTQWHLNTPNPRSAGVVNS